MAYTTCMWRCQLQETVVPALWSKLMPCSCKGVKDTLHEGVLRQSYTERKNSILVSFAPKSKPEDFLCSGQISMLPLNFDASFFRTIGDIIRLSISIFSMYILRVQFEVSRSKIGCIKLDTCEIYVLRGNWVL